MRLLSTHILTAICLLLLCSSGATAAASMQLQVSATVLSQNQCRFSTATSTLPFGIIDPLNTVTDVTVSTSLVFRCGGRDAVATYIVTDNGGAHPDATGGHQMQNVLVTTSFLPYTLTYSPATGSVPKNINQTLTVTATIHPNDFQTALAGDYLDTVVLSIDP